VTVEDVPAAPGIDLGRLQAEINEEVRHRRATGDFPPGLERELDAMFARYAPAGTGDDFDDVLASAQTQSFIHADVPTSSRRAPLAIVKRALRMAMAWYVRFVAQQVTAFAGTITRAVSLLARRVDALETLTVSAADQAVARRDLSPWADVVVTALTGTRGRVLHTECGDGALIRAMLGAGVDAYGVEPSEELAVEASSTGLDVRTDTALAHLRKVPDDSLAAVVLSLDTLPVGEVLAVAGRATAALAPGGTLVVLSAGPLAWARTVDPVVADLSPGRPLHADTWRHVLEGRGVTVDPVLRPSAIGDGALVPLPAGTPGADVLNANIERLNAVLFADDGYALVARKPG
jgi:hypothetical protein